MRPFTLESATVTFSVAAVVLVAGALYRHLSRPAPGTVAPVAQGGGPSSREAPLNVVGSLAWLLAILLALGVELWEFAHGPRSLHPTLSSLLNDVLGPGHRVVPRRRFSLLGHVRLRDRVPTRAAPMNVALWCAAAAALIACEVAARTLKRGWPTSSRLVRTARDNAVGRVLLVLAWLWLGWHVFAR